MKTPGDEFKLFAFCITTMQWNSVEMEGIINQAACRPSRSSALYSVVPLNFILHYEFRNWSLITLIAVQAQDEEG